MESYRENLWKRLEYWWYSPRLTKITQVTRGTYSIEPTPQDAGEISAPSNCMCNSSSSHLRSINSFDIIDNSSYQICRFVLLFKISLKLLQQNTRLVKKETRKAENRISLDFLNSSGFAFQFVERCIWSWAFLSPFKSAYFLRECKIGVGEIKWKRRSF